MSHTKRRFVIDCDVLSVLASLKFCSIQKIPPLQIVIKFIYCDMLFESVYVNECLSDPIKSVFILLGLDIETYQQGCNTRLECLMDHSYVTSCKF